MKKTVTFVMMVSLVMLLCIDGVHARSQLSGSEYYVSSTDGRSTPSHLSSDPTRNRHSEMVGMGWNNGDDPTEMFVLECIGAYLALWAAFGVAMDVVRGSGGCGCSPCTCGGGDTPV